MLTFAGTLIEEERDGSAVDEEREADEEIDEDRDGDSVFVEEEDVAVSDVLLVLVDDIEEVPVADADEADSVIPGVDVRLVVSTEEVVEAGVDAADVVARVVAGVVSVALVVVSGVLATKV